MSTQHTYRSSLTIYLHDGAETDFDLVIGFSFTPGKPDRGPSYASGGEPACPPEAEIDSVRTFRKGVEHLALAHTVRKLVEADEAIMESLIETAQEDARNARDHHAELDADERRAGR